MNDLSAFACSLRGYPHETTVHSRNSNAAKSEFLSNIRDCCPDAKYTDVRVRRLGEPQSDERFEQTARYRGVPLARIGMRVIVGTASGVIVGSNSSANFDVLFDDDSEYRGARLNCHPTWEIAYFDDAENILYDFRKSQVAEATL